VQADCWLRRRDVARLATFIARVRPHVLSTHAARATLLAAPVAKWRGAKVVETYHGAIGRARARLVPGRVVARFVDRAIAVSEAARASLVADGYPA
jgi:hypothetical protein